MNKFILLFSHLFLVAAFALAQDENQARKKLEDIGFLIGDWNVSVEARLSAQGPWESSQGRSQITQTVGFTVFEEDFSGTRQGRPFITKSLIAVNNLTLKYQRIFVDSEHGALVDFEGYKSADSLIFDKTWVYPSGTSVQLRVVYAVISPNEFRLESMRKPDQAPSWDVTGRMNYTRAQ